MSNFKSDQLPQGFYNSWNIERNAQHKLDEYSLLRCTYSEFRRFIYKAFTQKKDRRGEVTHEYDLYLLYKGRLFTIVWQNDAFTAYVLPEKFMRKNKNEPEFIISIRECQGERVAIVQRQHKQVPTTATQS